MAQSFTGFSSCPSPGLVQRCVIIQKDQHGFGFTVSGDRIVLVQSVRPGERVEGPGDTSGPPHLLRASGEMYHQGFVSSVGDAAGFGVSLDRDKLSAAMGGWVGNSLRQPWVNTRRQRAALGSLLQEMLLVLQYNDFAGWQGWEQQFKQTMSCLFYSGCSHLPPPSPPLARKPGKMRI